MKNWMKNKTIIVDKSKYFLKELNDELDVFFIDKNPNEIIDTDISNNKTISNFEERWRILELKYKFYNTNQGYQYWRRIWEDTFEFITLTLDSFEKTTIDLLNKKEWVNFYNKEDILDSLDNFWYKNLTSFKLEQWKKWKQELAKILYEDHVEHWIENSLRWDNDENIDSNVKINFNLNNNEKKYIEHIFLNNIFNIFENTQNKTSLKEDDILVWISKTYEFILNNNENKIDTNEIKDYLSSLKPLFDFKLKEVFHLYLKEDLIQDEWDLFLIFNNKEELKTYTLKNNIKKEHINWISRDWLIYSNYFDGKEINIKKLNVKDFIW